MNEQIKQRITQLNNGEVPNGYEKTEIGTFPVGWKTTTLDKLLEFKNGVNADKEKYNSGVKMISVMDILTDSPIYYDKIKGQVDIDEKTLDTYSVTYGDILFQRSSETFEDAGKSNVYLDKDRTATYSGFVIRGKKKAHYNPYFLNEALRIGQVRNQIIRNAAGSQHINVGQDSLAKIIVPLASNVEQSNIAEILMKWDEAIELYKALINEMDKKRAFIIRQIVSKKAAWKVYSFFDILEERIEYSKVNNQHEVLSSTKQGLFAQNEYFDKQVASENNIGYKVIREGDLVLSPQNLWLGNINYNNSFEIGMVSPSYKVFKIKDGFDKTLVSTIMKLPIMLHKYVLSSEQGASVVRRNLNMDLFYQITISLPGSEEQQKLGNVIAMINKQILLYQKQYDVLIHQRKTLQQYLLNGIVRV